MIVPPSTKGRVNFAKKKRACQPFFLPKINFNIRMSIRAPIPSTNNTGQAIAMIPANAQTIIANAANTKITRHKVIMIVPP